MISILVTAFNEPNLDKTIKSIITQDIPEDYELIIIAPDKEAEDLVDSYKEKNIKYFKDHGNGKANALNLVFSKLQGDIIIATDGDVLLDKNSIKNILNKFKDKNVGAVSGRPVAINDKNTMLGYFSNLLLDAGAHRVRLDLDKKGKFIECTGYLFGFRNLLKSFPTDVAEDSIIPYLIWKNGYRIRYAADAIVKVMYPDNIKDFIKQRKRAGVGSHAHLTNYGKDFPKVKTFKNEVGKGLVWAFDYPGNLKELIWTFMLILVRGYIWGSYYFDEIFNKKRYADNWERIDSTKNF